MTEEEPLNTQILTAILSKDSKDSTYKYALLRALVETVIEQSSHRSKRKDNWVSYPFGLLVYYWVLYYYPIFGNTVFIPQKNGESPTLEKGKTIAFRREFNRVIKSYEGKGDLSQFRYDLIRNRIHKDVQKNVIDLLRKIQHTIKGMPMKHLGYSVFNEHYSLTKYSTSTIRTPSYYGLISEAGDFFIHPDLHQVLEDIGTLIIGQDSIIDGWADFTTTAARRSSGTPPLSKEKVLTVLTKAVDIPRDVSQVKSYLSTVSDSGLECVWTGSSLKRGFHIDHTIPYSMWQNNNLWNLVPVKSSINLSKRDLIPSPSLIDDSANRIKRIWGLYADRFGKQFDQGLFEGLGIHPKEGLDPAIQALKKKSSHLIIKRGFQKFEIT